jgi:hypothetical protein
MKALRVLTGAQLDPVLLPLPEPSPLGTVPNPAGPVLSPENLRTLGLGQAAIDEVSSGADAEGQLAEDQRRLRKLCAELTTPPAPGTPPEPEPLPLLVDQPEVPAVRLTGGQRAMFRQVVERLRAEQEAQAGLVLTAIRRGHSSYPGGLLDVLFPALGADLAAQLATDLTAQAADLSAALQEAPDRVDAVLAARRQEATDHRAAAAAAVAARTSQAADEARRADVRTRSTVRAVAAATRLAAVGGRERPPRVSRTEARVERAIAELREPVALELARLDEQLRGRRAALTDAVRRQVAAIGLAQARDQLTLARHPPPGGVPDPCLNRVTEWAADAVAKQERALPGLLQQALDGTDALKAKLRAAAAEAMQALRQWGAAHTRAGDAWWAERDADLARWATDAAAQAEFWASEQEQASRLALVADLDALQRLAEAQDEGGQQAVEEFVAGLDGEARAVVLELTGGGAGEAGPDYVGAVLAGLRERVRAARHAELETQLDAELLGLDPAQPEVFRHLRTLLGTVQPDADLEGRADRIENATHRWVRGHDEDAIFEAMAGLTPLAARLLPVVYRRNHHGETLESALIGNWRHHLSADELDTADQLVAGSRVDAAVGTIRTAIGGPGANVSAVNRTLRALTKEERSQLPARYRERYHEEFEADLRSQWSVSQPEVAETIALLEGDVARADAIALGATVYALPSGGEYDVGPPTWAIDREHAEQVLARSHADAEAEGRRRNWTSAQVAASATARTQAVLGRFDQLHAGAAWAADRAPGSTPSQVALTLPGAGGNLLQAIAAGDRTRTDVARVQIEDAGAWASDKVLLDVFQDQSERSRADVERDYAPILAARREARLRGLSGETLTDRRLQLEIEDERRIDHLAEPVTRQRMADFGTAYQAAAHRSLSDMVRANMSGVDADEAQTRIRTGGILTPSQQIQFAVGGWRTDVPRLRTVIGRMTKAELVDLERSTEWDNAFPGRTVLQVVDANTSGRDVQDLTYMVEHGRPRTARAQVDAVLDRVRRDRAQGTAFGRWLASTETEVSERDARELWQAYQDLHGASGDPAAQRRADLAFGLAVERATASVERQRRAVDEASDLLANIASVAAAVIIGAALAPFTGGASAVVAAAVLSSVGATVVSMGVKRLVKGGAYGRDEFTTDLAIGAVDAIVSGLTAGLGKALLGPARGLATAERSLLFRALMRLGPAGRAAARAQLRTVALLGRFGAQGLVARALERRALLAGLYQSEHRALQWIAQGAAHLIEAGVQAAPVSLAGALADRETVRGGPGAVLRATAEGTVHTVGTGLALGAAQHIVGAGLHAAGERLLPRPDLATPRGRLAAFHEWRTLERPSGSMWEFHTELTQRLAAASTREVQTHALAREARRALLAGLPPAERGRFAGLAVTSFPVAEFARLPGDPSHPARLVTAPDGRAVIVLQEGASPSAAAALLPEVRRQVLAGTGGLTVSGALPPDLRDVPAFHHPDLPGDEIRVVPQIAPDGTVTGVELHVGPQAHPADVALHASELRRWLSWAGLLGRARNAVAGVGRIAGLDPLTPRDRVRFEAAGELAKLEPLARERVRRYLVATTRADAPAAERIRGQIGHLLAQLERARRIATGEVTAEPRGYVAMSSTLEAPPGADAVREIRRLREEERAVVAKMADSELQVAVTRDQVALYREELENVLRLVEDDPRLEHLTQFDLDDPRFATALEQLPASSARPEQTQPRYLGSRQAKLQQLAKGQYTGREALRPVPADLVAAQRTLEAKRRAAEPILRRHAAELEALQARRAQLRDDIAGWLGAEHVKIHAEVLVSPALAGHEPTGGWRLEPRPLLKKGSEAQQLSHRYGEQTEVHLANYIAEVRGELLVKWGAPPGEAGLRADIISVDAAGNVTFWDAKFRSWGEKHPVSETFSKNLDDVREEALRMLRDDPRLTGDQRVQAMRNVRDLVFTTYTVSSEEMGIFHYYEQQAFTGTKTPSLIRRSELWRLP